MLPVLPTLKVLLTRLKGWSRRVTFWAGPCSSRGQLPLAVGLVIAAAAQPSLAEPIGEGDAMRAVAAVLGFSSWVGEPCEGTPLSNSSVANSSREKGLKRSK